MVPPSIVAMRRTAHLTKVDNMPGQVTVDGAAVVRAWVSRGSEQAWLELVTADPNADEVSAVVQSTLPEGVEEVGAKTRRGYVTLVDATEPANELVAWLDTLATRLTSTGFTGALRAAHAIDAAPWLHGSDDGWVFGHPWSPAAFIAWSGDLSGFTEIGRGPTVLGEWPQPSAVVDSLCEAAAEWVAGGGADRVFVLGGFGIDVGDAAPLAPLLRRAARMRQTGALVCSNPARPSGRRITLRAGMGIGQVLGEVDHWRERIDAVRPLMLERPDLVDIAYVRTSPTGLIGWGQQEQPMPLPAMDAGNLTTHRHLLTEYTPDAHGLQVLRDAHLEKAHDLGNWVITDLGHGRHLVEAPDLKAWYGSGGPDGTIIEQARLDFGSMILTSDTLLAAPPPWVARRNISGT